MSRTGELRRRLAGTPLRGLVMRCRERQLRPADVLVASYPRSGSTWLRFMLYELATGSEATFPAVNESIPYVGRRSASPLLPAGARLIKTHEPYRTAYRRAIYLFRDARDVFVSEYFYRLKRGQFSGELDPFLERFLRGTTSPYGVWNHHVSSWLASPIAGTGLYSLSFEDLRASTASQLEGIAAFLGLEYDRERIERVVANNSVGRMQSKEHAVKDTLYRGTRQDIRFVRKGKSGGWRTALRPDQASRIEAAFGPVLERLGYCGAPDAASAPDDLQ